jgi:LPXTG-site transpeptidase (sortase) family protein
MNKSLWLISAGMLLVALTISNFLFGFPISLFDILDETNTGATLNQTVDPALQSDSVESSSLQSTPLAAFEYSGSTPNKTADSIRSVPLSQRTSISGFVPDRIVIPSIQLDAPVILAAQKSVEIQSQWFEQWSAPDEFAAGWQADSAPLGVLGNTVINGHHNVDGKVFGHLVNTKVGDTILIYSGQKVFEYQIAEINVLREKNAPLETRQKNAQWISTTSDERLTLVTCWPKRTNTHRLIVVAYPVQSQPIPSTNLNTQ